MYLRHTTIRKNGKDHIYWRLVRSVRHGAKVRQETVAYLGELDKAGRLKAKALKESILGKLPQEDLFDHGEVPRSASVDLQRVHLERSLRFGDVWLAWTLWRALGLEERLSEWIPEGREEVPWASMAAILVIARLCEPSSELHIAEDWYRRTALEDLVGIPAYKINDDRLYRALDELLPHKEKLEKHLKEKLGQLFDLKYDLMLYDVTSTYFEGEAKGIPIAQRGHSRDQRPDCKQVCIALVVSREGMPLGYELFAGNRVDVTTVEEIVESMEKKYGKADRVWVMDRGMTSQENLEFLRERQVKYLLGTPKSDLKKFEREILSDNWEKIREGLEVKRCPSPDGEETFILCRSEDRKSKEKAMHDRFIRRIEEGLQSLGRRLERAKKPEDRVHVGSQVGRLLQRNSRGAGAFKITFEDAPDLGSGLRLRWEKNAAWSEWASHSEGCYLLRSNIRDWSAEDLWRTYIQLTQAEAAFRIQKSDLSIRPIWHQKEDRVRAHILVCFLGYVLWKMLEQWQSRAGLGNSPRTILEEVARIQSTDVVLPLVNGREIKLRCVVRPDRAQALLLQRLGLDLPDRLRLPAGLRKM
ncbi:MAG: IS1634 family transposase [Candidatus Hydrogenedentota bacterium]